MHRQDPEDNAVAKLQPLVSSDSQRSENRDHHGPDCGDRTPKQSSIRRLPGPSHTGILSGTIEGTRVISPLGVRIFSGNGSSYG